MVATSQNQTKFFISGRISYSHQVLNHHSDCCHSLFDTKLKQLVYQNENVLIKVTSTHVFNSVLIPDILKYSSDCSQPNQKKHRTYVQ